MSGDEQEAPPPKHLGDYPDGVYWSAVPPESTEAVEADDYQVSGNVIRFMWDYTVIVPLWDAEGLLPDDPQWLRTALGLDDELIEDLRH